HERRHDLLFALVRASREDEASSRREGGGDVPEAHERDPTRSVAQRDATWIGWHTDEQRGGGGGGGLRRGEGHPARGGRRARRLPLRVRYGGHQRSRAGG